MKISKVLDGTHTVQKTTYYGWDLLSSLALIGELGSVRQVAFGSTICKNNFP